MRQPAVAGRFYPGSATSLEKSIEGLFEQSGVTQQTSALAVVSPHAGYIYSGALAAKTINSVAIPKSVIVLGPNHTGQGPPVSLSTSTWDMAFGPVPHDEILGEYLQSSSNMVRPDESAHQMEHSLEVQIPFLQKRQPDLHLTALAIARISYENCRTLGQTLADAAVHCKKVTGEAPLIVASTDMSHFESRQQATRKDSLALQAIEELDPEKLYRTVVENRISMCGFIPVVTTIVAVNSLGAAKAELVGYTDSGYVSGDTDQVVGYAGFVIS